MTGRDVGENSTMSLTTVLFVCSVDTADRNLKTSRCGYFTVLETRITLPSPVVHTNRKIKPVKPCLSSHPEDLMEDEDDNDF